MLLPGALLLIMSNAKYSLSTRQQLRPFTHCALFWVQSHCQPCNIGFADFPPDHAPCLPGETGHSTLCKVECTLVCMSTAIYLRVSSPKVSKAHPLTM